MKISTKDLTKNNNPSSPHVVQARMEDFTVEQLKDLATGKKQLKGFVDKLAPIETLDVFLESFSIKAPKAKQEMVYYLVGDIYDLYLGWCEDHGQQDILSKPGFTRSIHLRGILTYQLCRRGTTKKYFGILHSHSIFKKDK